MVDLGLFVEATLTSAEFQGPEHGLVFNFLTGDKSRRIHLRARGVVNFVGEAFRWTNIVDFVNLYSGNEPSDEVLLKALKFSFHGYESDIAPPKLAEQMAMVRNGELVLFGIVPVYGAEITILAREIRIEVELAGSPLVCM